MKQVISYIGPVALNREVAVVKDALADANQQQLHIAALRESMLMPILEMQKEGIYGNVAIRSLIIDIQTGIASTETMRLAKELGMPSRSTLHKWLAAYKAEGRAGLLPRHTGRVRQDAGWEAAAIQMYNKPSKPSIAAVARQLREEGGFETATDKRVRTFIDSLPAQLGDKSPTRIGRHKYNNSQKQYRHRTTENIPVGAIYQGDGHTIDVYLAHPETLHTWRAELTVWMDVRSRYIVGWHLSKSESAISTIYALSLTLVQHDHVPAIVYIDNGSGYKSKMMTAEHTGYYERMGIEPLFAIPGNAKAKGNIERFFRTMERDFNTRFGEAFCGEGMASEVSSRYIADYNRELKLWEGGKLQRMTKQLPNRDEWVGKFRDWLHHYHNRPHPEDKHTTPAQLWATLQRTPVHLRADALLRPSDQRKVQRSAVQHDNRWYANPVLLDWNGRTVAVEFDLEDDAMVTVRDLKGKLICDAPLVRKKDYIPDSRMEQASQRSMLAAIARKKRDIAEIEQRAMGGLLLENDFKRLAALEELIGTADEELPVEADNASALIDMFADDDSEISIDILKDDY